MAMWRARKWHAICTRAICMPGITSVKISVWFGQHRTLKLYKRQKHRDKIGHNCCQYECKNLQSNMPSIDFTKFYLFETDENGCTSLIGCSKRSYCTLRRDQSGCERCECEDEGEKAAVSCPVLKKCSKNCKYGQRWKMLFYKGRALFYSDVNITRIEAFKRMHGPGAKCANVRKRRYCVRRWTTASRKKVKLVWRDTINTRSH